MYENWSIKMDTQGGISRNAGPGLYEFLMEAELQQYYAGIRGDLKVQTTAQLKYVTEDDLTTIGMSKPEMRRLKKYFQKHFPQNYLLKFKKMLLSKREGCDQIGGLSILAEEKQDKPPIKVPNKHMIPADAIIVNKELGTGEFGVVQQGVWTNDGERIQVAIKCLSRERMQNNPIEFLKEAAIMHAIDHEHIVRLYGVVLDTNSLMLVTELAPLRSLLECLKEPSLRASFPVLSLCDFSIQISDGMQYLEAKRLIHRDLAARNILVFSKNKVKISDFGLSRALGVGKDYYQTNFNVNLKLPIAWCAPECISYLKFTSASDVWAYGVTLWEMFSYGFQPWAALTGHQILEAIDEPNYQRLEQPDCCPNDYFLLMQQCWQHEPTKRPKFHELINLLPDLKPEQVQAVQDSSEIGQLSYRQSDIITVLDKGGNNILWKGVLTNGKTGLFNPAHTIAYLGSNLPSNKPGEFTRGDGKNVFSSSQRKKIRTDMISSPQGDLKHTGHVGLDGAYFGDISFLGGKYPHLPRQVVTPYKPHEDVTDNSSQIYSQDERNAEASSCTNKDSRNSHGFQDVSIDGLWSDTTSELSFTSTNHNKINKKNHQHDSIIMPNCASAIEALGADHEYHEISDEENQDSPLRFDKPLNFDFGPSLLDEMDQMFRSLGSSPQPPPPPPPPSSLSGHHSSAEHESSNARNELREIQAKQSNKKKQASVSPTNVKPISAADQKTLYSAIAMAQELTARSMSDLDHPPDSPRTPASPTRRRKFSFKLPHQHSPKPDRRHFSEEAASIPDIQATLSDEAKEVYNSLVETQMLETTTDTNPLRMLRSGVPIMRPRLRGNRYNSMSNTVTTNIDDNGNFCDSSLINDFNNIGSKTLPKLRSSPIHAPSHAPPAIPTTNGKILERYNSAIGIENNQNQNNIEENPIPLPPRDRSKTLQPKSSLTRHQRKHPLIIPGDGVTRTLAKMAVDNSDIEDQVDGSYSYNLPDTEVTTESKNFTVDSRTSEIASNSPDEFERRIDSELSALDSLSLENNRMHRCSMISEDLLEFSENLIDCDDKDSDDNTNECDDNVPDESCNANLIIKDEIKKSNNNEGMHKETIGPSQGSSLSLFKVNESVKRIDEKKHGRTSDLSRQSDHVSCEDLLEFACDGPNVRRTRGPHNGEQSDEVRIMMKVLHDQSSPESCVAALNATDWDVLAAIKLERLQGLLKKEDNFVALEDCQVMLSQCGGDVVKAAALLRNTEDTASV
ncbi:activated Cdc42 kinase-like isoform X5 [Aphidius gifuensis]|uniref:activated Cdc42 kinase-like isoform X5 n=1 Tax=Aphidius gifuensis TaxID=684658 RepID=UPI001CDC4E4A|nr:activated Cdc42 kinase-like isoform X5 [Aphidius gifuensis]